MVHIWPGWRRFRSLKPVVRCYNNFQQNIRLFNSSNNRYLLNSKARSLSSIYTNNSINNMAFSHSGAFHSMKPQNFDYFLVLDFEATCDNRKQMEPQEIIEFPVLKVNSVTLEVESTFHTYVCPQVHPELTPFCTELTGIIQDMVDGKPQLKQVLQDFDEWMLKEDLLNETVKFAFVTCGDWDLKKMLPKQCRYFNLTPASYFKQWINIKKSFSQVMSVFPKGMLPMLSVLDLKHEGRHHSGIDDCRNISKILVELLKRGHIFQINGRL